MFPLIAILSREIGVEEVEERSESLTDFRWVFICWSTAVGGSGFYERSEVDDEWGDSEIGIEWT